MNRILLRFENIQQIVGTEELSVIMLTDSSRSRVLAVVCDIDLAHQIQRRLRGNRKVNMALLPEALIQMLPSQYEMTIVGVFDGQYQVVLSDLNDGTSVRLRISDAVLLSIISTIPLYIEQRLMDQQSMPFDENAEGVAIPINAMDTTRLKAALRNAVDEENYELASQLRDEINSRKAAK